MILQRKRCFLAVWIGLTAPLGSAMAQPYDPDAGDEAEFSYESHIAAVAANGCDTFGSFGSPFTGTNRYRGNVYRLEFNATLKEIKMELRLDLNDSAELHVAIHRKDASGDYLRYPEGTSDIIIPNAAGTGLPVFYTTANANPPMPEILLEAGYDYSIAFAWGSKSVTYGRDSELYPIDFRAGQVLGSSALNSLPPPPAPLVPDILPEFTIFVNGVYSMQLCFKPEPGACCSNGGCAEVLETSCTGSGSFFHSEYSRCYETPCVFGACCTRCGECLGGYTEESCLSSAGGVNFWAEVSCPDPADWAILCPPITGACCRGTTCTIECKEQCEHPPDPLTPGVYLGDATSCTPNMCQGACCVTGACLNRTRANCVAPNVFKGEGTTCLTLPPANQCGGACCRGFDIDNLDFCEIVSRRSDCVYDPLGFPSAAYRGDRTTCPADCNPMGTTYNACCLPDGTCVNMTSSQCTAGWMAGVFNAGQKCEDSAPGNLCAASLERCCFTDGTCKLLTNTGCTALGGDSSSTETTCPANICSGSIPTGACCQPAEGACTVQTVAQCASANGFYQGNGTDCTDPELVCPGFGSCCRPDGECFDDLTPAECAARGGDYEGDGAICDPPAPPCEDDRGACCAISGTCLYISQAQCDNLPTPNPLAPPIFRGVGVQCQVDTCPAGACCLPGGCEMRTPASCLVEGGDFQDFDVECVPNLCVVGACCIGVGCDSETQFTCDRVHGVYKGDGIKCVPHPCPCNNNSQCDDGNVCTETDMCIEAVCTYTDRDCDDDNICTDDSCAPALGCMNPNNTAPCDDGNPKTTNDTCSGGVCVGGPPPTPVTVVKWESVLTHAPNFTEPVPLVISDDGMFSEPRSGIRKIVVSFDGAIDPATAVPENVTICGNDIDDLPVDLTGVAISVVPTALDTKMEINFEPALPNYARYRIEISTDIHSAVGVSIQAGTGGLSRILTALQGDAAGGGDRRVNATDLGGVRNLVGINPINPATLNEVRADVNNSGNINATDLGLVRGRVGQDARNISDPICP